MNKSRLITKNLIYEINSLTSDAKNVYWVVAFAMKSGIKTVLPALKDAAQKNAEIKILIGDYLFISQPEAISLLISELPNAEIRLFQSKGTSFHPKAYLFRHSHSTHRWLIKLITFSTNKRD